MTESIEDLIKNGYVNWRRNLILGVPFLLNSVLSLFTIILASIIVIAVYSLRPEILQDTSGIPVLLGITLLTAILLILIHAFFISGAVGMSRMIIGTGTTSLDDMLDYGKRNFISLSLAYTVVISLIILASILLALPAVAAFYMGILNIGLSLSLLGVTVYLIFIVLLSFILIPLPVAVVINNLGMINGLITSYNFFMVNKLKIFFIWTVIFAINGWLYLIFSVIISPFHWLAFISDSVHAVVILVLFLIYFILLRLTLAPLSMVWWTRLYIDRTMGIQNEPSLSGTGHQIREPPSPQPVIYM